MHTQLQQRTGVKPGPTGSTAHSAADFGPWQGTRRKIEFPVTIRYDNWDEYAQAAATLFRLLGIPYSSIEATFDYPLESAANCSPQIFVGTERIGGAIDLYEQYMSGELARLLANAGMTIHRRWTFDPARMLLDWMRSDLRKSGNNTVQQQSGGHHGTVEQHT